MRVNVRGLGMEYKPSQDQTEGSEWGSAKSFVSPFSLSALTAYKNVRQR